MRPTAAPRPSTLAAVLVLAGLLCAPRSEAAPVEPPERLSVDDAVQIAIANHPTVTVNRAIVGVTKARVQEAWAPWVPSLTGSFSYNPQTSNRALPPSFAGTSMTPPPATSWTLSNYFTANLGVSWSVFDFGKTWYNRQVALDNQVAAERGVDAAELQVALDVRTAFYTALAAKALTDVSIESVATQRAHLDQVRGFVEVGTRTPVDVAKSQSDLAAAQLVMARARGNEEAARGTLHVTLGLESWRDFALVSPTESEGALVPAELNIPGDPLAAAVDARPETRQAAHQVAAAAAQRKVVRSAWFPQLTLSLGPTFQGSDITNLTPNFGLNLALSYLGGINLALVDGQRREADANLALVGEQARATRNGVRLDVAQAIAALHSTREALLAAKALAAAATEQRRLANGRFEAGLGTLLERQDAELNYVQARQQIIQAEYDLRTVEARIAKAFGRR